VRSQEYPVVANEYRNGESQLSVLAANNRKRWRLAMRLPPVRFQELREFYDARSGATEPFYFYDLCETNQRCSGDPTGQATTGRYIVRFEGAW
jgi:hypothetical protein